MVPAFADLWMEGDGSDALEGTDNASAIDDNITASLQNPLDRVLHGLVTGCLVSYSNAAELTVGIGSVVCANSGGTVRRMRRNTSATTVGWANIDTGAEANNTYYVYAVADADATTFTVVVSLSDTFPTGVTYAKRIGQFVNASGDITQFSTPAGLRGGASYANGLTKYDSGWFSVAVGSEYSKTHNLGTTMLMLTLYYSSDSAGASDVHLCGHTDTDIGGGSDNDNVGAGVSDVTTTTLKVRTGKNGVAFFLYNSSGQADDNGPLTGYLRVVALALE